MHADSLSDVFAALAHPARRAVLARLSRGEAPVQELLKTLKLSAPAVTKHLKVLERTGLISRSREAQWRPCRLEREKIRAANDWMAQFLAQSEQRMDRLATYLDELQRTERVSGRKKSTKQKGS